MNNCNCSGLLPLIFGYITGRNQDNSCGCGCDQNVMPIGNNGWNNDCWLLILLLFVCGAYAMFVVVAIIITAVAITEYYKLNI